MNWKLRNDLRPLLQAALITSPVIAALLVTPVFLLNTGISVRSVSVLLTGCLCVFLVWTIHLLLLRYFPAMKLWRLIWATLISSAVFGIFVWFSNLPVHRLGWELHVIRTIVTLSINALVFIISTYILLDQSKRKVDVENEQLKFANLEARHQLLLNQINPHFLFNSIGTAKALIREDPAIADEYLVKLSAFLRFGFDTKFATVTVREELAVCADYIALQQMRFGDSLRFHMYIEEEYMAFDIPFFSLVTLVENAIKHNSMSEEQPLFISFYNEKDNIVSENNIYPKSLVETTTKTGLQNLSERYRLLFGEPIKVERNETQFRVIVKMFNR